MMVACSDDGKVAEMRPVVVWRVIGMGEEEEEEGGKRWVMMAALVVPGRRKARRGERVSDGAGRDGDEKSETKGRTKVEQSLEPREGARDLPVRGDGRDGRRRKRAPNGLCRHDDRKVNR